MQTIGTETAVPESIVTGRTAQIRLAIGVLQGVLLYLLYIAAKNHVWPGTEAGLFAPLMLAALYVPLLLVSGLGHLPSRRLGIWIAIALLITLALGFYDQWRIGDRAVGRLPYAGNEDDVYPSALVLVFTGLGLFIAHALVTATAASGRRIADYPSYFETAWKFAIQIKFCAMFVGVLWLVLWLGATLFMLVKLEFLRRLLEERWFSIPVTAFAVSAAFHLTDVRPGIVRGIRSLLLVLMSWLLPITVLIVGGFLATLPFTGLQPLWATRHATASLLGAAAVLVLLVNAAFQNGEVGEQVARVLRFSARGAAVLLTPIVLIAVYSLGLRVHEYGWTTDRIIAAACLLVVACYAAGYLWAAVSRGAWLARIAPTNVATAFVILAVLLSLFSPAADPARLSVASQIARLEAGRTAAAKFDFDYLKFEGKRYGQAALQKLSGAQGENAALIRDKVAITMKKQHKWDRGENVATVADVAANITVMPAGTVLPPSFANQAWWNDKQKWMLPGCLLEKTAGCDAYLIDMGAGDRQILLAAKNGHSDPVLFAQRAGAWEVVGSIRVNLDRCWELREALAKGKYRTLPSSNKDIEVAGQRFPITPTERPRSDCGQP